MEDSDGSGRTEGGKEGRTWKVDPDGESQRGEEMEDVQQFLWDDAPWSYWRKTVALTACFWKDLEMCTVQATELNWARWLLGLEATFVERLGKEAWHLHIEHIDLPSLMFIITLTQQERIRRSFDALYPEREGYHLPTFGSIFITGFGIKRVIT